MATRRDYYEVLGVKRDASEKEIRQSDVLRHELGASAVEPAQPGASDSSLRRGLDAEQGLDLVPGRDERKRRYEGENEQADPEPDV